MIKISYVLKIRMHTLHQLLTDHQIRNDMPYLGQTWEFVF